MTQPIVRWRIVGLVVTTVLGVVAIGYLVGWNIKSLPQYEGPHLPYQDLSAARSPAEDVISIRATSYSDMRQRETGPTSKWPPSLVSIPDDSDYRRCITCHNPHSADVEPNDADKRLSLATRSARRAFNGAPPVIPHTIEQTDDAACYVCHNQGARLGESVANRMSHGFLVNCVQCHAAPTPKPFAHFDVAVDNTFAGLPAPIAGERAFAGAPPVIPHSTWMRERCLSCHGGVAGWPGLEVTHRWRTNCQQCHATSPQLEQAAVVDTVNFVSSVAAQQP